MKGIMASGEEISDLNLTTFKKFMASLIIEEMIFLKNIYYIFD